MGTLQNIFHLIPLKMRISILAGIIGIPIFLSMESFAWFQFKIVKQQTNCLAPLYNIDPYAPKTIDNIFPNYKSCNQNIKFNKPNIDFISNDMFK